MIIDIRFWVKRSKVKVRVKLTAIRRGFELYECLLVLIINVCVDSIQIYWFGPLLGGVAGGKLYDVVFVNSLTALQLLKTRLDRVVQRFSRPPVDTVAARCEAESVEQWSTMTREDGGVWRENSLYRARSLLVDRAVQSESELTTKTVAENCLALTLDAINQRRDLPDNDEATPTISQDSVVGLNDEEDIVVEEFHSGSTLLRRESYRQAVKHKYSLPQPTATDVEEEPTASAAVEEIQQSTLDTVSELEEPEVHDALKEPDLPAETTVQEDEEMESLEANLDEVLECEKEANGNDASSTRADILDSGSEELDVVDSGSSWTVGLRSSTSWTVGHPEQWVRGVRRYSR